ncbi:MAG: hypothetical protein U1E52_13240 [Geminicoccaceae bacterium]
MLGILVALGALLLRLQGIVFGPPTGPAGPVKASSIPLVAHLALVMIAGVWLPPPWCAGSSMSLRCWAEPG